MTEELQDLEKQFIMDDDMEHNDIKKLIEQVLHFCRIDNNGFVIIQKTNLIMPQKILLVLTARHLANKLQEKLGREKVISEIVTATELSNMLKEKNAVILARLKELKDAKKVISADRGIYKIAPYIINDFLVELEGIKNGWANNTLFRTRKENISILKEAFSVGKAIVESLVKKTGKNKGTISNSVHDLKILSLVDDEWNVTAEAKNVVCDRGAKDILKTYFLGVKGNKETTNETISCNTFDSLEVGKSFCFHTNARASKESSIRQIGRLYLRWLRYLDLIENKGEK